MIKKIDIAQAVMTCLKDRTIQSLHKKEALQLVAFMVQDIETIKIFTRHRIEDSILDFL